MRSIRTDARRRVGFVRRALVLLVLCPLAAAADISQCNDSHSECKDDCTLEFGGSIRTEAQKRFTKCVKKCAKKLTTCTERELETTRNGLENGALDSSPVSGDVDENGMPTRTAVKKARSIDDDDQKPPPSDDLREDRPARVQEEPVKAKRKKAADEETAQAPREEVRDSEVPRSARTQLKSDEKSAPKEREDRAEQAKPIVMEPKPESRKPLDEDLRDDGKKGKSEAPVAQRSEDPPPPPKKRREEPRAEEPRPAAKPKEEDHDDLRNF
jgi:hypothetical protein